MIENGGPCGVCGTTMPYTLQFCSKCGKPLPWAQHLAQPPLQPPLQSAPIPPPSGYQPSQPAQTGAPGCITILGVALLCFVGIGLLGQIDQRIPWLVIILSAIAIYFDAKSLGVRKGKISGIFDMNPGGWAAATVLLWLIAFPAYIVARPYYERMKDR